MKRLIVILLCLHCYFSYAQDAVYGNNGHTPERYPDKVLVGSSEVALGDTLNFGRGSSSDGQFDYIFVSFSHWHGDVGATNIKINRISANYAGKPFVIKEIKRNGNKRKGYNVYGYIKTDDGRYLWCDLLKAERSKEIIIPQLNDVDLADKASRLIKLKALLDSNIISREDYDNLKKKVLSE